MLKEKKITKLINPYISMFKIFVICALLITAVTVTPVRDEAIRKIITEIFENPRYLPNLRAYKSLSGKLS